MNHLILLGDSIFDNRAYVGEGPAVIDQVQLYLPQSWRGTLLAVDGNTSAQVTDQLKRLPSDSTHRVLSVGGNDALECLEQMGTPVTNLIGSLDVLSRMLHRFENSYTVLMSELLALKLPLLACTIYYSVPGLTEPLKYS